MLEAIDVFLLPSRGQPLKTTVASLIRWAHGQTEEMVQTPMCQNALGKEEERRTP